MAKTLARYLVTNSPKAQYLPLASHFSQVAENDESIINPDWLAVRVPGHDAVLRLDVDDWVRGLVFIVSVGVSGGEAASVIGESVANACQAFAQAVSRFARWALASL
jgi:hypothetical protein